MENTRNIGSTYRIRTLCQMCPIRDGITATVQDGEITKVEGDPEHSISRGYTCNKGRHGHEAINHAQRFKQPLLKTASGWKEIPWEEAFDIAAE